MSWSEVSKINNNMKRSINEQLRDMKYQAIRVVTSNLTYTPEKTGLYKIICVGKGGNGYYDASSSPTYRATGGGGGGVAVKTMRLSKDKTYQITASSSTASFASDSDIITATGGASGTDTSGGSASGGDYNFPGTKGATISTSFQAPRPGSVGVVIADLLRTPASYFGTLVNGKTNITYTISYEYGDSILNYGGGGTGAGFFVDYTYNGGYSTTGKPAAVIIIPIEMEE